MLFRELKPGDIYGFVEDEHEEALWLLDKSAYNDSNRSITLYDWKLDEDFNWPQTTLVKGEYFSSDFEEEDFELKGFFPVELMKGF